MKVLFLCNKSPYPPDEGGPMAMNANIQALLKAGHSVKVIAMNTNKYFVKTEDIPEVYKHQTGIEFIYNDLSIKPREAFLNLFSRSSYHIDRFISKDFEGRLTEILQSEEFDIIQLEMLHMTPYLHLIRKYSGARVILRSHNIEHLIWERITQTTGNFFKRKYLALLTKKLKRYELETMNQYDGIITISGHDADYFIEQGCSIPIAAIPFGVATEEYIPSVEPFEFPSLFHLGSMNWMPNEEGIRWFVEAVWPLIHTRFPKLRLYLAGRMMPDWLVRLREPNVEVVGAVDDARSFIYSKAVMVVPLLSGSGIRIKIIEGMALGKAIISTTIGAEGINYTDGKNILIADNPEEFAAAIEKCLAGPEFCRTMGENARTLILEEHSLEGVAKKLERFYNRVLEKN